MNKEKSKKKVNVDTIMDRIVKLLATVACLTIAGIIVIATLPIKDSFSIRLCKSSD